MIQSRTQAYVSIALMLFVAQAAVEVRADTPAPAAAPSPTSPPNDPFKSQKPKVGTVTQVTKKPTHHPGVTPPKPQAVPPSS